MGDIYSDMPTLVDAGRGFEGPQPLPAGVGIPSPYFPYEHARPPPSSFMQHSQSYSSSSSGYPWSAPSDSQATATPPAWPQMQSTPTTPMPMFAGPPVGMMPAFVPAVAGISADGWPGSPEPRQREERTPQWRPDRYEERRLGPPRSSTPHSQSISLSSSPSSGSGVSLSLSRRPSLRGPAAEAAKRPPREWRSDFSMTGQGLLGSLLTRSRSKSFGGSAEFLHPKVTLNAYIRYNSSKPPMQYDLRRSANTLRFRALDHALTSWDLTRFVCEPPVQEMRLFHAALPWYIDVEASSNPSGVTLYDLFLAIQNHMLAPIKYDDFYNNEMNNDIRDQIAAAWGDRCGRSAEERNRGVCKVDFLMGKVIMEGIQKGKDGLWEIKTRKP